MFNHTSSTRIALLAPLTSLAPTINPQTDEETQIDDGETGDTGFRVILYDDDYHGMDEVVLQIQKATGCELERAVEIMLEAHAKGRAVCFRGAREKCHRVANVLRQIRLQVEVDCD